MNRKLWFEWGDGGAGKERERRRKNEEHKYQTLLVCSKEFDQSRRICICGNTSRASIFNDSRLSNKNSLWRRRMFDISFNNIHHFLIPFRQSDESIRCTASSQNECGKIWMHDERAMTRVEEEVEEKKKHTRAVRRTQELHINFDEWIYAKYLRVANIQRKRATPINSSIEQCDYGA